MVKEHSLYVSTENRELYFVEFCWPRIVLPPKTVILTIRNEGPCWLVLAAGSVFKANLQGCLDKGHIEEIFLGDCS